MTLFDAEVSMDAPEDRALSRVEQDEDKPLPGKRYLYRYDVEPAPLESPGQFERHLLACRYGTNADAAMREKADSALLLVPPPYKTKARCDVISEQYQPGVAMPTARHRHIFRHAIATSSADRRSHSSLRAVGRWLY